jgi:hypothetical protein
VSIARRARRQLAAGLADATAAGVPVQVNAFGSLLTRSSRVAGE